MSDSRLDGLLKEVFGEAAAIGIPVDPDILPGVAVNGRATSRLGCCRKLPGGGFLVELSRRSADGCDGAVRQLLAHELLHTCPGCQNHGALWRGYARQMAEAYGYTIKPSLDPAVLGLDPVEPRYLVVCEHCGAQFPRQRECRLTKHPSRYRCRCGGRLRLALRP